MRCVYSNVCRDDNGDILSGATITVYLAGTATLATIYTTSASTSAVSTSSVTSNTKGEFTFYVDRFDYDSDQKFKYTITKTGYTTKAHDYVDIDRIITGTYTISADKTVSTHITVPKGVIYSVASGKTLTFSGSLFAGPYQIFSGSGTVAGLKEAYPEWWGIDGTADEVEINKAITATTADGTVHLLPAKTYTTAAVISLKSTITLDMTGATIMSHHSGSAIAFGTSNVLIGYNAEIYNDVDIAVGLLTTTAKDAVARVRILGWPYIHNGATARNSGSIGIDGEVFYDSYIEAKAYYFEKGIVIGGGTEQSYYNTIMAPKCYGNMYGIYASKDSNYTNALTIFSPWISGQAAGKYGITLSGVGSANITGGYLESFLANSTDTKGIHLIDSTNIKVKDITIDSSSSVANYAIYAEGTCARVSFDSIRPAGGWSSSSKVLSWSNVTGGGAYDWKGTVVSSSASLMNETANLNNVWTGGATGAAPTSGLMKGGKVVGTQLNVVSNNFVSYDRKVMYEQVAITASASISTTVAIPSLSKLIGVVLRVDEALATGETWDAAYSGGSTLAIATNKAVAKDTTVKLIHEAHTDALVTTDSTYVTITKNGGGSFTAQGKISVGVVYEWFEALPDAP